MQLGLFLKRFRKEVSLSGESLAKRMGVKRHSLEKWENNDNLPNYHSATKIQRYFGIESLDNISEETLIICIENELRKPKQHITEAGNKSSQVSQILFQKLNFLNNRVDNLEKIVKEQVSLLKELEKARKNYK